MLPLDHQTDKEINLNVKSYRRISVNEGIKNQANNIPHTTEA